MAISRGKALAVGGAVALGGACLGVGALSLAALGWSRRRGFELSGRTALVTGGSRGLGFAVARELLRRGSRVAICARDAEELRRAVEKLAPLGAVLPVRCDLTEPDAAAAVVAAVRREWGPVEVLVHCAGVIQLGHWDQMTEAQFHQAMDLHCWAALRLARAVLPDMIARRQGRVVNISSIGGVVPVPHMLPYVTSKFALVGLSQGLASEVRRHGVRVTCVCPFLTRTGSQERAEVRGRREFNWFAAAGSLPGLTQSAVRAARAIVESCRQGRAQVVLSLPGQWAAWVHGLAPSTMVTGLAAVARWLPEANAASTELGPDRYGPWSGRILRPLIVSQGRDLNQS